MSALRKRMAAAVLGLVLCSACGPRAQGPVPVAPAYQAPAADLNHDVYIVTDRDLRQYRATESGLDELRRIPLEEDATVGMGATREGLFLWRDGDWFSFTPELEPIKHRSLGFKYTYSEFLVASSPTVVLADLDKKICVITPNLEPKSVIPIPGIADDIIIRDSIAYVLDPQLNKHFLVKIAIDPKQSLKKLQQVEFYEGPESKGNHWLDARAAHWMVLMRDRLLVFDTANLQAPPTTIPCNQAFDLKRLDGGGPFRVWKNVDQEPLWALGHDTQLAVARLEINAEGLATAQRLSLTPSRYPLMSAPFIKRAGSRLYASDGGDLWIIDLASGQPRLLDTLSFRYGLGLVTLPHRR